MYSRMEVLQDFKDHARSPHDTDSRWLLAKRVAASAAFARSDRLSSLLLYVCRMHIDGRDDEINEQRIGIEVFGRTPNFDSGADSIVRSHATRLRRRLDMYFGDEGCGEALRIEIPPGAYVPRFFSTEDDQRPPEYAIHYRASEMSEQGKESVAKDLNPFEPQERIHHGSAWTWRPWASAMLSATAVVLIAVSAMAYLHWNQRTAAAAETSGNQTPIERQFWSGLMGNSGPTLIVTGDSGLVLYETYSKHQVSLSDYLAGVYRTKSSTSHRDPHIADWDLAGRRYTSVADLSLAIRLSHLPQWKDQRDQVVFARDLRPSDAAKSNLILLGSRVANPWDSLVDGPLNFVLTSDGDGHFYFLNRHPEPGEKQIYAPSQSGSSMSDASVYALICYKPNIPGMSKVLLLSGLWLSGTQAAGEFVLNHDEFSRFLSAIAKPGGVIPPFEILVQIRSVAGSALNYSIVAKRVG